MNDLEYLHQVGRARSRIARSRQQFERRVRRELTPGVHVGRWFENRPTARWGKWLPLLAAVIAGWWLVRRADGDEDLQPEPSKP
ncbi:MAG: hypothetical protein KDA42_16065 [Planctomycetales bacterium]|nr:hypothetical protein [Planctomycetales bacterium]